MAELHTEEHRGRIANELQELRSCVNRVSAIDDRESQLFRLHFSRLMELLSNYQFVEMDLMVSILRVVISVKSQRNEWVTPAMINALLSQAGQLRIGVCFNCPALVQGRVGDEELLGCDRCMGVIIAANPDGPAGAGP